MEREYLDHPLLGVGALVVFQNRVLLIQRAQEPNRGEWTPPGGLVEVGETVAEAVRREVREECGLEVAVGPILGLFEPMVRDAEGRLRYHYVVLDMLAYYQSGDLVISNEVADARWLSEAELTAYGVSALTYEFSVRALQLASGSGA